jgi:hypothetical protein
MKKKFTKMSLFKRLVASAARTLARLAIVPMMLLASPAWASLYVEICGTPPAGTTESIPGLAVEVFSNNDMLAKDQSALAVANDSTDIAATNGHATLDCGTSTCYVNVSKNGIWLSGTQSRIYIKLDGSGKPVTYSNQSCEVFTRPNTGFVYDTNNFSCIQKADTSMWADVHMWDQCNFGSPQDNRQWELSENRIRNASDRSRCLTSDSQIPEGLQPNGQHYHHPEPADGDKVLLQDCMVINTVQDFVYNTKGQNLIRMLEFPDYCMYRTGSNKGDTLYVAGCDANNANGRWNVSW